MRRRRPVYIGDEDDSPVSNDSNVEEGSDNREEPEFSAHESWSRLEKTLTEEVGKWPGSQLGELAARLSNFAATLNHQTTEKAA